MCNSCLVVSLNYFITLSNIFCLVKGFNPNVFLYICYCGWTLFQYVFYISSMFSAHMALQIEIWLEEMRRQPYSLLCCYVTFFFNNWYQKISLITKVSVLFCSLVLMLDFVNFLYSLAYVYEYLRHWIVFLSAW